MSTRVGIALLLLALVSGCSTLEPRSASPEPEPESQRRELAVEMLAFVDRLGGADADELTGMGERLRIAADQQASVEARLRYAYWRATPGHPGFDPQRARRRLEGVLADTDGELAPPVRALARLQLRHLRQARAWRSRHAELRRENEQLRQKLQELTNLERRMGSDR